ncbi:MAG: uracil-DNA glycosylase [Candidatus Bipolaricaulia bacterium]
MAHDMMSLFNDPEDNALGSSYEEVREVALSCLKCRLKDSRTQVVFGEGPVPCGVMFVGEGPGADEDAEGRPFVGRAGQLLDQILEAAGMPRETVYISNVVKCRPPENRAPQRDEIQACWSYLEAEIHYVRPSVIVTLGNIPTKKLLDTDAGITKVRGEFFDYRDGIQIFPMFHPSYLLRNPSRASGSPKHLTWQDIQAVKARLDGVDQS